MEKRKKSIILFIYLLLSPFLYCQDDSEIESIEINKYDNLNYFRSTLFMEQDLIYGRSVV